MTALPAPWTLSGMEQKNKPLENDFRQFLEQSVQDKDQHVKFLNTLSMLEHLGSRKIMLSQMNETLTQEILKHLSEETRHAFFFKRQAEKIAGCELDGYNEENCLARVPALMYFGRLDASITANLPTEGLHSETNYLWVSLIIELRACWTYHMYQEVLEAHGRPFSLKSVIAEEDMHMADMYDRLGEVGAVPQDQLENFCQLETDLFRKFFAQLYRTQETVIAA